MTAKAKNLLKAALQLTTAERESLAGELFESLEPEDPDAELAWQKEIERRIEEVDSGKVKAIPWAEARRMIFGNGDESE